MLGADDRALQPCGHERHERLARAAERDEGHVGAEVVLASGVGDRLDDLVDRAVEQLLGSPLRRRLQACGERRRRQRARRRAPANEYAASSTSPSAFAAHVAVSAYSVPCARTQAYDSGSPVARRDELELRVRELLGRSEAGIREAGDVGAARARLGDRACASAGAMLPPAAPTTQLSTARTQVGRPMTRSERTTGRPRLTIETFELVPPHSTTIASERPSWCSAAATPAAGPEPIVKEGRRRKAVDAHGAAVAAQHEQRHVEPRLAQRVLDDRGGALDDGEDAGVHRRAHRPHLEPVGAREVVADAGRQSVQAARSGRRGARPRDRRRRGRR